MVCRCASKATKTLDIQTCLKIIMRGIASVICVVEVWWGRNISDMRSGSMVGKEG